MWHSVFIPFMIFSVYYYYIQPLCIIISCTWYVGIIFKIIFEFRYKIEKHYYIDLCYHTSMASTLLPLHHNHYNNIMIITLHQYPVPNNVLRIDETH